MNEVALQAEPVQELYCVYYFDGSTEDFVLHSLWNYAYQADAEKAKLNTQFKTVGIVKRTLNGLEQDILHNKKTWIIEALQAVAGSKPMIVTPEGWTEEDIRKFQARLDDTLRPGFIARPTVAEPTQIEWPIRQVLDSIMRGRCFICDWTMGTSEGGCTPFNCSMRYHDGQEPHHIQIRRETLNLVLEWMKKEPEPTALELAKAARAAGPEGAY